MTDRSRRRPAVRVLAAGLALTVEGCGAARTEASDAPALPAQAAPAKGPPGQPLPTANPPPPVPAPVPAQDDALEPPMVNPPPPLPTWDEVASSHPKGATNPPSPVLEVSADGARCWKAWRPGMIAPGREEQAFGGRVVLDGQVGTGTEIVCPQPQARDVVLGWSKQGR